MKPALLVIGMQEQPFCEFPGAADSLEFALSRINIAVRLFHDNAMPVVCVRRVSTAEGMVPGAPRFEWHRRMERYQSDIVIDSRCGSAFHGTGLDRLLAERGVDTIFLAGFCAEHGVLSTYRGAQDHGFAAIMLRGSLASPNPENIRFVECVSDTVSVSNLEHLLCAPLAIAM
jgi:nicotinamidase-related amidase